MILKATFEELNNIISQKTPVKGLSLSYCAPDTATLTMVLSILGILNPSVSAKVKLVSIEGSRITAAIDAGNLGDFVLDKAKKPLLEKVPAGLIESFDNKVAVINLDALPELKSVFEAIEVGGISFTEEAVLLDASMK